MGIHEAALCVACRGIISSSARSCRSAVTATGCSRIAVFLHRAVQSVCMLASSTMALKPLRLEVFQQTRHSPGNTKGGLNEA